MDRIYSLATARARGRSHPFGQIAAAREGLEIGLQLRRLPSRGRDEGPIEKCRLAIAQRRSVGSVHESTSGEKYRVPGCGVPLARRRGSRVNIRLALGDDAELQ